MKKKMILSMMIGLMFLLTACGSENHTPVQSSEIAGSSQIGEDVFVEPDDSSEEDESEPLDEEPEADTPVSITLGKDNSGNDIARIVITLPNKQMPLWLV